MKNVNIDKILVKHQFEEWLYNEAKLLDEIDFDGWYALLHPSIEYRMPVRVNKEGMERPDYTTDIFAFEDDYETLKMRVERLKSDYAWAEIPPSRTRRFVSNVRIMDYEEKKHATVQSYLLIYRNRLNDIHHDLISGERSDQFLYENGEWKLAKRTFIVDQTTIDTRNLAIFV